MYREAHASLESSLEPVSRMPSQGPSSWLDNSMDSPRAFSMRKWILVWPLLDRSPLCSLLSFQPKCSRPRSLQYTVVGHTTNTVSVISQDYKPLWVEQWCTQSSTVQQELCKPQHSLNHWKDMYI